MAVFIPARISSPSVDSCPRHSLSYDRRISVTLLNGRSSDYTTFNHNDDN